jgi:hypothetical protein
MRGAMIKRYLMGLVAAAAAFAGSWAFATPALAAPPTGNCPASFFPYPYDPNDPNLQGINGQPSLNPNGDDTTCVNIIDHGRAAVVDNASNGGNPSKP